MTAAKIFDNIIRMVKIGDLVRMKKTSHYPLGNQFKNVAGIVIDVVIDDAPKKQEFGLKDYWAKIVFFDGTKATLFCDEIEILDTETKI